MTLQEAVDELFHVEDLPEEFFDLWPLHPHRPLHVFANVCIWCGVLAGPGNGGAAAMWITAPIADRYREAERIAETTESR